nr:hypothetical protein BaRGS_015065 [Batillaria attramentaria]
MPVSNTVGSYFCSCQWDFYQADKFTCLEVSHVYAEAKVWSVLVRGFNAEGFVEGTMQVRVIEPVRNLTLETFELAQSPTSKFQFIVTLANVAVVLEDLTCTFTYGDGTTETFGLSTMTEADSVSAVHEYDLGVFDVSVTCSNNISSMVMHTSVTAEESISGLAFTSDKEYAKVGETVYLTVETQMGSNLVLRVDLGDGRNEMRNVGNNRRGHSVLQMTAKYSQVGRYFVSVQAENLLSTASAELPHEIQVLNLVKDLVMTVNTPVGFPPGVADLTVEHIQASSPPTDVSCLVDSPHLPPSVHSADEIDTNKTLDFSVTFTDMSAVGANAVAVNCSNAISFQVLEVTVLMQAVIQNVGLSVSEKYIMVKGAVDVSMVIGVGSHAQYLLDYGDGDTVSGVFTQTVLQNKHLTFRHAFETAGIYNVTLNVLNHVSEAVAFVTVGVLEEVTDLYVTAWYQPLDHNDTLRGGHGPSGALYPLERDVVFVTSLGSGNDVTYVWNFGDGMAEMSSRDPEIRYRFSQPGQYRIFVNASNALFYDTATVLITVHQTVLMHILSNDGPTDAYRTINFTLTLARPGTDSCLVWDMGDGSEDYVYGGTQCSKYTDIPTPRFLNLYDSIDDQLRIRREHMYRTNETFYVTVRAYNLVSEGVISDTAVVSGVSCHYPEVRLAGGGQQIDKPVLNLKSDWISFESTVDIDCEVTQEADYSWKVDKILTGSNFLDFIFSPVTVDTISAGLFKVLFAPGVFELGTYRVSLNVSMKGIPGLYNLDFAYFRIDASPLVTYIRGGNARSVGYDKVFTLDAIADSYDPDIRNQDDKSDMTFRWFCRRPGEDLPDEPLIVPIPTNISEVDYDANGGCFGTGVGELLSDVEGILEVNSFFLEYLSTNVFVVEVRKDERVSVYEQAVTIVAGDPPELNIE